MRRQVGAEGEGDQPAGSFSVPGQGREAEAGRGDRPDLDQAGSGGEVVAGEAAALPGSEKMAAAGSDIFDTPERGGERGPARAEQGTGVTVTFVDTRRFWAVFASERVLRARPL